VGLVCPDCRRDSLSIAASLELPSDSRSDEITIQVVECAGCGFEALAVYEESRRGGFDSGSVDHRAYRTPRGVVHAVRHQLAGCPSPKNARCRCAVHRLLGTKNAAGRWVGLQRFGLGSRLSLEYRSR
jgi:hypothetical protein